MSATQASAEARADITAEAAEGAGAADAALGLNPLVGFGTIDMLVAFQQIAARMASNPLALVDQVGAFGTICSNSFSTNLAPNRCIAGRC
jgi:hypothetical protein